MVPSQTGRIQSLRKKLRRNPSDMSVTGPDGYRIPPSCSSTTVQKIKIKRSFVFQFPTIFSLSLILFLSFCISLCHGNEQDSLQCAESGTCEESIHTVIKLVKRDDEMARRIARSYGLEVKVANKNIYFGNKFALLGTTIFGLTLFSRPSSRTQC